MATNSSPFPPRRRSRRAERQQAGSTAVTAEHQTTHQAVATPPVPVPVKNRTAAHVIMLIVGGIIAPIASFLLYEGSQLAISGLFQGTSWASPLGTGYIVAALALIAITSILSGSKSSMGLIGLIVSFLVMAISIGILTPFALENAPSVVIEQILMFGWSGFTPALLGGAVGAIYALAVARRRAAIETRVDMNKLSELPQSGVRLPPAPADRRTAWIVSTITASILAIIIVVVLFVQVSSLQPVTDPPLTTGMSTASMVITTIIMTLAAALFTSTAYLSTFGAIFASLVFMILPAVIISIFSIMSTPAPLHSASLFSKVVFVSGPIGILGATLLVLALGAHWARKEGRAREIADITALKAASEDRAMERDNLAKAESSAAASTAAGEPQADAPVDTEPPATPESEPTLESPADPAPQTDAPDPDESTPDPSTTPAPDSDDTADTDR